MQHCNHPTVPTPILYLQRNHSLFGKVMNRFRGSNAGLPENGESVSDWENSKALSFCAELQCLLHGMCHEICQDLYLLFWIGTSRCTMVQINRESRLKYWAIRMHCSLVCLLHPARFARALRCGPLCSPALTLSLVCSLCSLCSLPYSWESEWLDGYLYFSVFFILDHSALVLLV